MLVRPFIIFGAVLHDLGKRWIPKEILNKPEPLAEIERKLIRSHTLLGYNSLKDYGINDVILDMVLHHHDQTDVDHIKIICLADSYDAMTSDRPYQITKSVLEAKTIISAQLGKQFDR